MKKIFVCLLGCFLLALTTVRAQDTGNKGADSVIQLGPDTTTQTPVHSTISRDTTRQIPDTSFRYHGDTSAATPSVTPAASPASRSIGDSTTPATATTTPATATPAAGTTTSSPAATPQQRTPDTLITLTDAPNPQSTVSNDTLTTRKTQGGHTIEIKTVGATIDTTQPKDQVNTDAGTNTDAGANTTGQARTDQQASDTASQQDKAQETTHRLDPRWFLGIKGQFQDFAFLEKNREGYLSNANTLPFSQRGNTSVALSAYKNLTGRLSASADLGLSFGHVTSNDVLISQTKKMTFNELNIAFYYHLLPAAYRLQPYVTVGFNDIINNGSYPCVPMGIGAKFNSKKVMVLGQVTYGQSVSHSIASTTMYSVGVYIPLKSKKYKNLDTLDTTPYNRMDAKKKDSTGKGGTVINNIYVTINMDSILKAKGLLDDNGNPTAGNSRRGDHGDGDGDDGDDAAARSRRRKKPFKDLGLDDFNDDDYKIDSIDGKPVIRFVVYFEFNEYGLNSKAFNSIDKVIQHLRRSQDYSVVEIKGYTDSVGSDPFNNMLSRRRAKMVLDYMNSRGIPTNIMKAQAYGRDNPVADNSDPNKAWLNRRAEIIIYRKSDLAVQ
ncbi:MAG TPA: OmpA family protein [Puia sp.]|nr:OmpA family protein [Puia sp.]